MLTSKQRAQLRSLASNMDVIMQVGKSGVTEAMAKTVSDALEARELIKMRVLENSGEDVRDAAEQLAAATDSEVVAVIGKCFHIVILVVARAEAKHGKVNTLISLALDIGSQLICGANSNVKIAVRRHDYTVVTIGLEVLFCNLISHGKTCLTVG